MKLSTRYDIEAPIGRVFAELVNFDHWERAAMRRGADVTRSDRLAAPGPGMGWRAGFRYRGKDRKAEIRVDRMEPPTKLEIAALSALADATVVIDLVELSVKRTRLNLYLDIQPKTLAAKLYVQSLKLAKARVDRSFQTRVGQFVLDLEDRIRRS